MNINRHTTAVIRDTHITVRFHNDLDGVAVPGQGLIHRIVDHFKNHVVQTGAIIRITDVHTRAFTYRIKPLQDLDAGGIIFLLAHIAFRLQFIQAVCQLFSLTIRDFLVVNL